MSEDMQRYSTTELAEIITLTVYSREDQERALAELNRRVSEDISRSLAMVREFHEKFDLMDSTHDEPTLPIILVRLARVQMLIEECGELAHAFAKGDLVETLDALVDIQYFLDGTFLACGLGAVKLPAMREVHRSNLTKLGPDGRPIRDESGRVVKGPDYDPPQLEQFINQEN